MSINLKSELISSELFDTCHEGFITELLTQDSHATLLQEGESIWIGSHLVGVLQAERIRKSKELDQLVSTLYFDDSYVSCDLYEVIDSQLRIETFHTIPLLMGFLSYELLHTLEEVPHAKNGFPAPIPSAYFGLYQTIYEITKEKRVYQHTINWTLNGKSLTPFPRHIPVPFQKVTKNEEPVYLCGAKPLRGTNKHPFQQKESSDIFNWNGHTSGKVNFNPSNNNRQQSIAARLDREEHLEEIFESNFSRPGYLAAVEKIKGQIRRGEYYQINLSQQLKFLLNKPRVTVLQRAIQHGNAPRKGIIQSRFCTSLHPSVPLEDQHTLIVSISPELFFEMRDNKISCAPIKGTRKRSCDTTEDRMLRDDLLTSPKDNAELSMIVDLVRNDLSRICSVGSVEVVNHRVISTLEHVHHTYSTVTGTLIPETSSKEIISALYPCGSITGAPKIAAMKEIANFEGVERGPYCGGIGYWGSNQSAHFNVAIRTATIFGAPDSKCDQVIVNSGGGITLNSDEESEYIETLHKLKSILLILT